MFQLQPASNNGCSREEWNKQQIKRMAQDDKKLEEVLLKHCEILDKRQQVFLKRNADYPMKTPLTQFSFLFNPNSLKNNQNNGNNNGKNYKTLYFTNLSNRYRFHKQHNKQFVCYIVCSSLL